MVMRPTFFFCRSFRLAANLAMVVVLPTPVGPIRATMCGPLCFFRSMGPPSGISFSSCSRMRSLMNSALSNCSGREFLWTLRMMSVASSSLTFGDHQLLILLEEFFGHLRRGAMAYLVHEVFHHRFERVDLAGKADHRHALHLGRLQERLAIVTGG